MRFLFFSPGIFGFLIAFYRTVIIDLSGSNNSTGIINSMRNRKTRKTDDVSSQRSSSAAIIIIIFILIAAFGGFLHVSSRPGYCAKCHEMQPSVDSWTASDHNDVSCVKCHYSPGSKFTFRSKFIGVRMHLKKLTQSYSGRRPLAHVRDASCSTDSCHPSADIQPPIIHENVSFSHTSHMESQRRAKLLACTSCHSEIVHGETRTITDETCFLCHLRPIEGETLETSFVSKCTNCHNPPSKILTVNGIEINHLDSKTASMKCTQCHHLISSGDGDAPITRCRQCHADVNVLNKFNDVAFLHDTHVTNRGMVCSRCHHNINHSMPEINETIPADCESCHPNHHEAETLIYNAYSFNEGEDFASAEFISHIACKTCHIHKVGDRFDDGGITYLASAQSCSECHYSSFGSFLEEWRHSINRMLNDVRSEILITRPKINSTPFSVKKKEELAGLLDDAEMKLLLIERGKSVHNIKYCDTLIRRAHDKVNQVLSEIGAKNIESERIEAFRFASKERCNICHFGIADYTTMFGSISFNHTPHLAEGNLPCTSCHEFKSRWEPHGELKFKDAEGCKQCHGKDSGCGSCHTGFESTPISVYGKTYIHKPHLDKGDMKCLDCHSPESAETTHGQARLERASDCTVCHHGPEQELTCADCHDLQTKLQKGKIPYSDISLASPHNFSCDSCHDTSSKHSRTLVIRKCTECHDQSYADNVNVWVSESKNELVKIRNMINRTAESGLTNKQAAELERISERVSFLSKDPAPGVHNYWLWEDILTKDIETLREWLGD